MASYESMLQDRENDEGFDEHDEDSHVNNLSVDNLVSGLSIESFDTEGELSPTRLLSSDSENELGSCYSLPCTPPRRRKREKEYGSENGTKKSDPKKEESDQNGVMVITRPKGGNRALCMDLEEVKACRDLGFELEHQRMLDIPSRLSLSNSTLDTSSGSNSPIANWRISSPGDDPRDVKARLKVWAQAVALVSASKYATSTPFSPNSF